MSDVKSSNKVDSGTDLAVKGSGDRPRVDPPSATTTSAAPAKIDENSLTEELKVALKEVQTLAEQLSVAKTLIANQNIRIKKTEASAEEVAVKELQSLAETEALRVKLKHLEAQNNSRISKLTRNLSKNLKEKISLNSQETAIAAKVSELSLFNELFYIHRYPEILEI